MGLLGDELAFARALTDRENESVMALGNRKRYAADAHLLTEGDRSTHVMIILQGWVTVSVATDRGATRLILGLRGPGELLGEMAALDSHPRSATVRALGPIEAQVIAGDAFRRFLALHPRVSGLVIRQLTFRLRSADQERSALASLTVLQRLASRLTELSRAEPSGPYAPTVPTSSVPPPSAAPPSVTSPSVTGTAPAGTVVHLAQDELAATVGATREAVAKALRLLRSQQIVRTGNRRVEILDPALLALLADGHHEERPE
ncbi:Crp/Fnr family transcriptional regulator [Streptomyces scopuliridis]|uniref:Crp/Fnr family transcriptional regulator n=1 Tax=Streptomyces scopuliridis TaxID=452529 RepID=A0ACD4ZM23_9ACTN|nr:Crp/Fnr family transcriptional regulator [Streptomyces scopuliridis]WSB34948.1 Crp/Fnr family transcriptional regulator [Streptomyces scopuliridis]WSB99225.1 Crp/Fnr family transcriptional regulator [Streptomyces scopuliridis]WSC07073.1 Crp/Fnr family transcriptional regulator [Streptomyces scopuliridis]